MCGLAGYLSAHGLASPLDVLTAMGQAIFKRGPDDGGYWFDADAGIGLAHRRLAIVDLSAAGHQPMLSTSGRYMLAFNGEIYNHQALRLELEQSGVIQSWRGHSDTETLLAGFDAWGIVPTITKSIGMFAIALWDKQSRELTLIRDRLGEKPLYYGWHNDCFLFASESKALKQHPAFKAEIDRDALALMMRHNNIPAPYSIYQDIYKLQPGAYLTLCLANPQPNIQRYWDARSMIADAYQHPFTGSPTEAVDQLEYLLKDSIAQQMMADVPLGAFLSGGVDSSTVVALMQAQSSRPVRTFSIGFNEAGFNEAEDAKKVAQHLGTDHTELYVSAQQALDVIPLIPSLYCEPFADSSQIPTYLVSKMAREQVTVSLSGDGGDELFGGYSQYQSGLRLRQKMTKLPRFMRENVAKVILYFSVETWNQLFAPIKSLLPGSLSKLNIGEKLHKAVRLLAAESSAVFYHLFQSNWPQTQLLVSNSSTLNTVLSDTTLQPKTNDFVELMMALDLLTFLPDDVLTKVDRAAMAVSLETRVPLLGHRIVEFAWKLPLDYKIRNGVGKWPLREVLYRHVPKELIERPKMGFGVPIDSWLRGPLREWAENLLSEKRLVQEGFFNPMMVRKKWQEHLSGQLNCEFLLWDVLMFQAWLEYNVS